MITLSEAEKVNLRANPVLFDSGCRRDYTVTLRYHAIERAILTMRERFYEPLTLQDIADAAQLSPFHFNRLFRSMTGISPSVFLAAIRLEHAKMLLLTTRNSITRICFDVGYISLGTFTTRFSLLVGLPPSHFRGLLDDERMRLSLQDMQETVYKYNCQQKQAFRVAGGISGSVKVLAPFNGLIFVGLFPDPLPQGQPVGCTMLAEAGNYEISGVEDGDYYLFTATMDRSQDFLTVLANGASLYGRQGRYPLQVRNGQVKGNTEVILTQASWADPPVLTALPWLFVSRFL